MQLNNDIIVVLNYQILIHTRMLLRTITITQLQYAHTFMDI